MSKITGLFTRRTQPNTRGFVSRVGYNTICTSYTPDTSIDRLSGSSLNRLFAKKRRDELKQLRQEPAQIKARVGQTIDDYREYESQINALRNDIEDQQGDKPKIPRSPGKRGLSFHVLSQRSKGKIRDKCTAFFRSCGKQRTFATLTFLSDVSDCDAVAILNKFFNQLREDYKKSFLYLWIAERQKTGRIHFHCIFNLRLPVKQYNALWVLQQYNHGLRYEGITHAEILQRYKDGTVGDVLNPFDIKNIKTIHGLSWYLTKYITKNGSEFEGENGFVCAAWHCSRKVSRLFTKSICSRSCLSAAGSAINSRVDRSTGEVLQAKNVRGAFYSLFYIQNKLYFLPEMSEVERVNGWILDGFMPDHIPETDYVDLCKFFNN